MTTSISDTIQHIRDFRTKNGMAKSRLAVLAGISENITRNMDDDNWNPTISTLKKIESAVRELSGNGTNNQHINNQVINKS